MSDCEDNLVISLLAEQVCDVVVTVAGNTDTMINEYEYAAAKTPTVTSISPLKGGTAGGTTITITGTNFG